MAAIVSAIGGITLKGILSVAGKAALGAAVSKFTTGLLGKAFPSKEKKEAIERLKREKEIAKDQKEILKLEGDIKQLEEEILQGQKEIMTTLQELAEQISDIQTQLAEMFDKLIAQVLLDKVQLARNLVQNTLSDLATYIEVRSSISPPGIK